MGGMSTPRPITGMLAKLTVTKAVATGSFRWVAFFLPTLTKAFGATTAQMTTVLGIGESAGLVTLLARNQLDRGRERLIIVASMVMVAGGSLLAASGRLVGFGIGYYLVLMGGAFCTVAGHSYLSRRVRYARRARVLGLYEMSWATGLLIGAPLAAALIGWVGWRGPFWFYALAAGIMGWIVATANDTVPILDSDSSTQTAQPRLTKGAWVSVFASAAIACGGLTTIAVAGTWLSERFEVSTGGVGQVAMTFGVAELIASVTSAAGADRIGPIRSTRLALAVMLVGLVTMTQVATFALAAMSLLLFFVGFEFAIVTSFSIVSEAMPSARGRVLTVNTGVGTLVRGLGVTASGTLYERFGVNGPATISALCSLSAIIMLTWMASQRPTDESTVEPLCR